MPSTIRSAAFVVFGQSDGAAGLVAIHTARRLASETYWTGSVLDRTSGTSR